MNWVWESSGKHSRSSVFCRVFFLFNEEVEGIFHARACLEHDAMHIQRTLRALFAAAEIWACVKCPEDIK